jgi:hypothetical protein
MFFQGKEHVHFLHGGFMQRLGNVAVGIERDRNRAVAQQFLHYLRVCTVSHEIRSAR